jgi:hypothetical protein
MNLSFTVESGRLHIGQGAIGESALLSWVIGEMVAAAASYMRE